MRQTRRGGGNPFATGPTGLTRADRKAGIPMVDNSTIQQFRSLTDLTVTTRRAVTG